MRSLIKMGLVAALFLGVLAWAMAQHRTTKRDLEHRLARQELRSEFLQRAPWVFSLSEPAAYVQEARGLFSWYAKEVEALHRRHPAPHPTPDTRGDLDARLAAGRLSQQEYEGLRDSQEQVDELWAAFAQGTYAPVMTGVQASMRIDFLPPRPTVVDGQRALQGRFVVWGAQRSKVEERVGQVTQVRTQTHASFHDVEVKLFDGKGKQLGQLTFGLPFGPYVPVPEQRNEDFPPGAFVGTYAIPLVPHEAESMEMTASLVSRAVTGSPIRADFAWKEPVPTSWKLGEGEAWEGAGVGFRDE
jgi:hypothetical protein